MWSYGEIISIRNFMEIVFKNFISCLTGNPCDKWVPVTTAWRVLKLRVEEWRVAANILNKQSRTADKGWYSSLGWARGNNSSP
jgi:hypothetical protein